MGIDVGSTTVKVVVIDDCKKILYSEYRRHYSDIKSTISYLFNDVKAELGDKSFSVVITGSGGLLLSKMLHV